MARPLASASLAILLAPVLLIPAAPLRAADLDTRYAAPFSTLPMYQTNTSVFLRDWNGDGLLDATVTCNADDRVSTLKGAGHGAFGGRVDFVGPDGPYKVDAGDMNGDGTADMVLALYDANSVRIYTMLPGDVSYNSIVDLPVGSGPIDVAVTDIDHDGDNDIVTSNFNSNNISVLLNDGGGTFSPHVDYAVGLNPWGMAVGRVNADAYPDVVTADFSSNTLTLWLGSAAGTLTYGASVSAGNGPTDVALVDLDGDGVGDMAVSNLNSSNITLVDAYGNIGLIVTGNIPSLSGYEIVPADFNNDGKIDLAVAGSEYASGSGTVHLGLGSGAFGPRIDFHTGGNLSIGMSAGDLDGDGKLDLALASSPNNLSILRGNGNGTFGVNGGLPPDGVNADFKKVKLAQMTADSHLDLVLAGSANVRVLSGNGSGGFSFVGQSGAKAVDIAVADLDLDGDLDVASVNGTAFTNLAISYNPGNGAITTGVISTVGGIAEAVAAGDFDHDGYPDLVVGCETPGDLFVLRNQQNGTFGVPVSIAGGGWRRAVAIVDVNGDSDPDVVAANYLSDNVEVYLGDGSGGFTFDATYATGHRPVSLESGDFNADGSPDLALACEGNTISVLLNSGAGTFLPAAAYSKPGLWEGIAVGSANQDAYPDLFAVDGYNYSVSILTGSPGGGFSFQARSWGVPATPEGIAVGDVNEDGQPDVVTSGSLFAGGTGFAHVLLYDTTPLPDRAPVVTAPLSVNVEVGGSLSLTVTARDPDLDAITSLAAAWLPPNATFTPNGTNTSGTVTYTAAAADVADYSAIFTASNALIGQRTTQIHVLPSTDEAGTFTWTPKPGDSGTYQVCFIATNLNGDPPDTTCTTVTVLPAGGAAPSPAARAGEAALSPQSPMKGPVVSAPVSATVTAGQTLVLTTTASDADALTADTSALPIGNDATFTADASPVVTAPANVIATPGVPLTIDVGAVDPDLTALTSLTASYPGLPPGNNALFVPSGGNGFGTFTWTPAAKDSGTYSVSFTAGNQLVGTAGTMIHVGTGLAGYWMLNGNGKDAANGANLANQYGQGETYVPGKLHDALQTTVPPIALTGTATSLHDFPLGQPRTLECWVQVVSNNSGAIYEIVSAYSFSGQWWRLYLLNQIVTFEIMQNGVSSTISTPLPAGGAWHHFALASDGATMTLYMDGVSQGSAAVNTQAIVAGGAIYMGVANGPNFQILVDDVRLWHRRRSQSEIVAMMNREVGGHVTDVESSPPLYKNELAQNRPNPFNPHTEIAFELARGGSARIRVYDASGRLVRTLLDRSLEAGDHVIGWDGIDAVGRKVASGVYYYRLETPGFEGTRKMLLLK